MNHLINTLLILNSLFAPPTNLQAQTLETLKKNLIMSVQRGCYSHLGLSTTNNDLFIKAIKSTQIKSLRKSTIPVSLSGIGQNLDVRLPINEFNRMVPEQNRLLASFLNKPLIFALDKPTNEDIIRVSLGYVERLSVQEVTLRYFNKNKRICP